MAAGKNKTPNSLAGETSPYLLQHAYNPVNWVAFSDSAFETAKRENKPILISIGYSACHWCHVMEHESFEDEQVAKLMNEHFINIKVDREERSDVDMLYMQAVQLMTGQGGWPLNCFVLPDGRPFYGGTYFRKEQWVAILTNLSAIYTTDLQRVLDYATELTNGIRQAELIALSKRTDAAPDRELLKEAVAKWKTRLDEEDGGPNRAPKFPLPSNYRFLLRYALLEKDEPLLKHVHLTLTKMALGGIYDQLHGGFSRYSTDLLWKVPHFEKMLYDNSQLASLYAEAYTLTGNELYREIATGILTFVEKEWFKSEGYFYSAFDADSDGEEGKYYVWTREDLRDLLGSDYDLFASYYEINEKGYWEHGNYILMRTENVAALLSRFNLRREELDERILGCKKILEQESLSRIKPGLDDKTITSWNAMMCTAYAGAYLAFGDKRYKEIAVASVEFILSRLSAPGGKLYRTFKNGHAKIDGFLDDYAFVIEALIGCYLITQQEPYLHRAKHLCELALGQFQNSGSDLLYYTDKDSAGLVTKTTETSDNVIPASNSQMAVNLFALGTYFGDHEWRERSVRMLGIVLDDLRNYGAGYSNWGCLALNLAYPFREIAIVGNHVDEKLSALYKQGITNAIFAVHADRTELPLGKDRFVAGETLMYVCENNACRLPVTSVEEIMEQLA